MTTTILFAAGLCGAIRYKALTAFPPEKYPSIKVAAWGLGHWHMPVPDTMPMPDDDPWVKKHMCRVDVDGDLTFAIWAEYVVCRLIALERKKQLAGDGGTWMYLMSVPLEQRNEEWAGRWGSLPDGWRQSGCKEWDQLQAERRAQQRQAEQAARAGKMVTNSKHIGSKLDTGTRAAQHSGGGSLLGGLGKYIKDPLDW